MTKEENKLRKELKDEYGVYVRAVNIEGTTYYISYKYELDDYDKSLAHAVVDTDGLYTSLEQVKKFAQVDYDLKVVSREFQKRLN